MPPSPKSSSLGTLQDPSEHLGQQPSGTRPAASWASGDEPTVEGDSVTLTSEDASPPRTAGTSSPVHWLVGAHWLGRWRTPVAVRLWRYGAGSVVAFATSAVVLFVCLSWFRLGAITSTIIAFLAGAIPNWLLNRRWAWEKRGRDGVFKETTLYVIVSVVALVASSAADKFTAVQASQLSSHIEKDLLVTFSYMFSVVVLSGLKYVAYDRFVFVDRNSRAQVPTTTEQNRAP